MSISLYQRCTTAWGASHEHKKFMHEFVIKFINNNININILYDKDNEIDNGNPPGMARYLLWREDIRGVLCRLKLNLSAVNAASLNSITLTDCKKSAVFVTRYSHSLSSSYDRIYGAVGTSDFCTREPLFLGIRIILQSVLRFLLHAISETDGVNMLRQNTLSVSVLFSKSNYMSF